MTFFLHYKFDYCEAIGKIYITKIVMSYHGTESWLILNKEILYD